MKVRAIKQGYYDLFRRREGEVFELKEIKGLDRTGKPVTYSPEEQFSERWMEKVDDKVSAKTRAPTKKPSSNIQSSDSEVI